MRSGCGCRCPCCTPILDPPALPSLARLLGHQQIRTGNWRVIGVRLQFLLYFTVDDLTAKLRMGGLRRDGYGVRDAAARLTNPLRRASPRPARKNSPPLRCGSTSFREHETYARRERARGALFKPCWVADSPAAGAWASFAPQPAHAQLCSQQGWRSTGGMPACHLQRRARPGRGANEAQAPAVDGLAAQRRWRAPQAQSGLRVRFWLAKLV